MGRKALARQRHGAVFAPSCAAGVWCRPTVDEIVLYLEFIDDKEPVYMGYSKYRDKRFAHTSVLAAVT